MDTNSIIKKIIHIPKDWYEQDKSLCVLVQESGYYTYYNQITETSILEALQGEPEYINEWINWSEDQRTSEGKYIKVENGQNIIAQFSNKGGYKETLTLYSNIKAACAAFIMYQIESCREAENFNEKKKK